MEIEEVSKYEALPLLSMNHVSLVVRCVWTSVRFYEDVLGFVLVKRPSSFKFRGAWLYNYGIGIHLLENESSSSSSDDQYNPSSVEEPRHRPINPRDNHMSFQCTDVNVVKWRLEDMGMRYVTATVEDEGIKVDQVFFHDPDGYMIEICNCENLPLLPISACTLVKPKLGSYSFEKKTAMAAAAAAAAGMMATKSCGGGIERIMESLRLDLMNFSF